MHVEFDLAGAGLDYTVGDSFGVYPDNDPELVGRDHQGDRRAGRLPDRRQALEQVLTEDMSLSPAPDMLFELISYMVGGERKAKAKALAQGEDPDGDAATLDVLAAVREVPRHPARSRGVRRMPRGAAAAALLDLLVPEGRSPTGCRSPSTTCATRSRARAAPRLGVASTFLSSAIASGTPLKVYIQRAHNFALPADPATPIVMVGPGTGVAPFRAFLHDRMAAQAPGDAWLFFGHQRNDCDFFYEDEFLGLQARQVLTRLSLAWSRDADTPKTYVQDRMRAEAAELWSWLQRGAHFYVCGDAKRMAGDVEKALVEIATTHGGHDEKSAKAFVADLKKAGRYQADVY